MYITTFSIMSNVHHILVALITKVNNFRIKNCDSLHKSKILTANKCVNYGMKVHIVGEGRCTEMQFTEGLRGPCSKMYT